MKLLVDLEDYSARWYKWLGYVILIIAALIFGGFVLISPFMVGFQNCLPFSLAILFAFLAITFTAKISGLVFNIPFKVYDEGIGMQPVLGLREKFILFEDIKSLELFFDCGWSYANRRCNINTLSGESITSNENFPSVERLEEFIEKIKPILEKKGFRLVKKEEHKRRYRLFRFER